MADTFALSGGWTITPVVVGVNSGCPTITTPLSEQVSVTQKAVEDISLTVDTAVTVPFSTLAEAYVVTLKPSRKVTARFTSADGTTQAIPVDKFFMLINSSSNPITALDLTREAGQATTVKVTLAGA